MGSQAAQPGWRGSGRIARLAVAAGRRMRFPCKDLWTCLVVDAGGCGAAVSADGTHGASFRQIAQQPYATVWRPMQAGGSVAGRPQGGTFGQRMRSVERPQDAMICETVQSGEVDAAVGSVANLRQEAWAGDAIR